MNRQEMFLNSKGWERVTGIDRMSLVSRFHGGDHAARAISNGSVITVDDQSFINRNLLPQKRIALSLEASSNPISK